MSSSFSGNFKVNYIRDGLSEEFHCGIVIFDGDYIDAVPYYLRSCAKPLQASLITDYNINFTSKELAFCCGSHAGEECHTEIAKQILKKIGLSESFLKCGIHKPLSRSTQDRMLLKGEPATQIHNNCSGKHLGFLAICKKNGWDMKTYYLPEHPLQIQVKNRINMLCEIDSKNVYPVTTDGCGVPILSMPLANIITGYKNLTLQYPKIVNAILENPYIYGGEDRLDTEIIQNSTGILAKVGAGGLCVVYNTLINRGVVVKMYDASNTARRIAVLEILKRLHWADIPYDNSIKTVSGKVVGNIIVTNLNIY